MCNVLDVANYVLYRAAKKGTTVSAPQLQKILYLAWLEFYRNTGDYLFSEYFRAGKECPYIPAIRDKFLGYARMDIYSKGGVCNDIRNSPMRYAMDEAIDRYIGYTDYDLRERVQRSGGAWYRVYRADEDEGYVIPFSLMKEESKRV